MTSLLTLAAFGDSLDAATGEFAARVNRSLVAIRSRAGGGSGTVWSSDGLIVTNHHVAPGDAAEVVTADDAVFEARVVDRSPESDLALLKIEGAALHPIEVGNSAALRVGEVVFASGNPWGQRGTLTAGIVLATGASALENQVPLDGVIRADLRLAPGNSGGPLVNARGQVVGINSMIAGGMAIAIPSNAVAEFVSRAAPGEPGFLGVQFQAVPLPEAIAASYQLPEPAGLMLTSVEPGSPAEQAGLLPGDILFGVDAKRGLRAIGHRFERMRAGHPLKLALLRAGVATEAEATPGTRT